MHSWIFGEQNKRKKSPSMISLPMVHLTLSIMMPNGKTQYYTFDNGNRRELSLDHLRELVARAESEHGVEVEKNEEENWYIEFSEN